MTRHDCEHRHREGKRRYERVSTGRGTTVLLEVQDERCKECPWTDTKWREALDQEADRPKKPEWKEEG